MSAAIPRRHRSVADDRGSGYVAAFIVLFATLAFGGVAVIADTGRIISADRRASAVAFEAARAAAQTSDTGALRNGGRSLDRIAAEAAARRTATDLLAGSDGTVSRVDVDADQVSVSVTTHVDLWFPGLADLTITQTGRARLAVGITEEGQ